MMPFMFAPSNCYMPHRTYYRAPCYARRPCGFSPCAHPLLFFVGAFFILPTLLRLAFFALTFFALNVAPFMLIACLLRDVCAADKTDANSTCHRTTKTTTTTKTKEDAKKDSPKEEEEEDASAMVHTVSASASMSIDDDLITVTLAVPGVRSKDLDVRVIDGHVLRVTGKTTKGGGVAYQVAEDVALPVVDVDSMTATHEDGVLSITVQRKIRRVTIPITSGEEVTTSTAASAPSAAAAASSSNKESSSEDEWEPLPVAKGRGQAPSTEAD